jgi:5-formyltetrahydrofolate cyclo-ligase
MSAAEYRSIYVLKRDTLTSLERAKKSEEIWKRLATLPVFRERSQALFYVSFKSEVDTTLMRSQARGLGMTVAVPRVQRQGKRMVFHDTGSDEKLEPGDFGVLQPADDPETVTELQDASVILVPGLVFDRKGNRLGWGEGYYDRFLAGEGLGLPSVGLAFDIQLAQQVPVNPHDVALNWIVTESGVIDCSAKF